MEQVSRCTKFQFVIRNQPTCDSPIYCRWVFTKTFLHLPNTITIMKQFTRLLLVAFAIAFTSGPLYASEMTYQVTDHRVKIELVQCAHYDATVATVTPTHQIVTIAGSNYTTAIAQGFAQTENRKESDYLKAKYCNAMIYSNYFAIVKCPVKEKIQNIFSPELKS